MCSRDMNSLKESAVAKKWTSVFLKEKVRSTDSYHFIAKRPGKDKTHI